MSIVAFSNYSNPLYANAIGINGKSAFGDILASYPTPDIHFQNPYYVSLSNVFINSDYVQVSSGNYTPTGLNPRLGFIPITQSAPASPAFIYSKKNINFYPGQTITVIFSCIFFLIPNSTAQAFVGLANFNSTSPSTPISGIGIGPNIVWYQNSSGSLVSQAVSYYPVSTEDIPFLFKIEYNQAGSSYFYFMSLSGKWELFFTTPFQLTSSASFAPFSNPSMNLYAFINSGTPGDDFIYVGSMAAYVSGPMNPAQDEGNSLFSSINVSSTTPTRVIAIQNSSTYSSSANQVNVYPVSLSIGMSGSGGTMTVSLYINPTIAGSSYSTSVGANSVVSYDTSGTTITIGSPLSESTGLIWFQMALFAGQQQVVDLTQYNICVSPGETLAIGASIASGSGTAYATLNWTERF